MPSETEVCTMNFLLRLAAVWTSVAMLASVNFSYADDLENLITTRQHVLNQFNDNANVYGNTRQATPVHPSIHTPLQATIRAHLQAMQTN